MRYIIVMEKRCRICAKVVMRKVMQSLRNGDVW